MKKLSKVYESLTAYEKAELWTSIISETAAMKRSAGSRDVEAVRVSFNLIKENIKKL